MVGSSAWRRQNRLQAELRTPVSLQPEVYSAYRVTASGWQNQAANSLSYPFNPWRRLRFRAAALCECSFLGSPTRNASGFRDKALGSLGRRKWHARLVEIKPKPIAPERPRPGWGLVGFPSRRKRTRRIGELG